MSSWGLQGLADVGGVLPGGQGDPPDAARGAQRSGSEGGVGVEALLFGGGWLLSERVRDAGAVGDLDDGVGDAVEVAGVVSSAGAELAADVESEEVGEMAAISSSARSPLRLDELVTPHLRSSLAPGWAVDRGGVGGDRRRHRG
jgi:hypothetical protein